MPRSAQEADGKPRVQEGSGAPKRPLEAPGGPRRAPFLGLEIFVFRGVSRGMFRGVSRGMFREVSRGMFREVSRGMFREVSPSWAS